MKSFFKKLSLVLAAAMVITMLPAQSIKAAGNDVVIGPSKELAQASQKFTMEVGSTAKWGFWGASDYAYKTDASSIRFTSSKPAVATIDNTSRVVTAVSAGETIIKFSVTTKSKTWTGEATLTVTGKGTPAKAEAKQYAKDKIYVTFATADEAAAAKSKTKVQLIKNTSKTEFVIPVNSAKVEAKDNVVIISQLTWGVTYRVLVNDVKLADVPMTKGTPTLLIVTYEPTAVGATSTSKSITGGSITNPTGAPTVTVYDENGIVIEQGDSKDISGIRFTSDSAKSKNASIISNTQGTVQFRAVDAYCYIKATYTFKVDNKNQEITWEGYATAKKYEAPSLNGFVEGIAAVEDKTDKVKSNIKYESFSAEMNAKDSRVLAYYFVGSDGYKYTGDNVRETVIWDENNANKRINKLDAAQYVFYFAKEDPNATCISISEFTGKTVIKGWTAGTERLYLYRRVGTTRSASDEIMGYIDITVNPEAVKSYLELDNAAVNGFGNGYDRTSVIKATIRNQYGNKTRGFVSVVDKNGTDVTRGISIANNVNGDGNSVITVTWGEVKDLFSGETTVREFYVKVNDTNIQYAFTISCQTIGAANSTESNVGYIINTADKTIKDSTIASATNVANMVAPIKVIKTIDGNRKEAVAFKLAGSAEFGSLANQLVVVITDSEGNPVAKDATSAIGTGTQAVSVGTTDNALLDQYPGYAFDIINDNFATNANGNYVEKNIIVGTFTATLYKVDASGNATSLDSSSFTITDNRQKVQDINNSYKVYNSNKVATVNTNVKVWDNAGTLPQQWTVNDQDSATVRADIEKGIIKRLYGWYDINSNGEAADSEVATLDTLFGSRLNVVENESDIIYSSDGTEVYVKYITITWNNYTDGITEKQTVEVNRKYTIKK